LSAPKVRESWPRTLARAFAHALWLFALLVVATTMALTWEWRSGFAAREYVPPLVLRASIGVALIGLPILYRRRVPQAVRWPATKRAWLLALPLVAALAIITVILFGMAMRGAFTG
jgi:glucose dehydrogenase